MQINEAVYGASETWIDARSYDSSVPAANRVRYANFGDNDNTIRKAYEEELLPLGTPWDKSLSYAALGDKMPLSNIQYYYSDKDSANPLKLQVINQDQRTITNYSLGTSGGFNAYESYVDYIAVAGEEYSVQKSRYNRYTNGASYNYTYSYWERFSPFTQIPLKRCVLVPYVEAYRSDFSYGQQFQLDDYINNQKNEYKMITRIFISMYADYDNSYDPDAGTGTVNRQPLNYQLCGGVILDPLSYGNGFTENETPLDNIFKPIIGNAIAGALFNSSLPTNLTTTTSWCVPVCSGFGLDFTKISSLTQDGEITGSSRFYCDADELTKAEIKEAVRHIVAGFGLFFTDNVYDAQHEMLDSDKMMLGTLVDGVGNGAYTFGEANRNQDQWNLTDAHDIDYDPSDPPKVDPNTYGVSMHTNYPWISSPNRLYSINATNVLSITTLYTQLWTCYNDNNVGTGEDQISPSEFNFDEFLTVSPIDTIVSLKLFPYDTSLDHNPIGIKLGRYQTQIPAYNAGKMTILEFGKVNIFAYFGAALEGDWRDRETRYTLYAPFCGTLDLDPAFYMGHDVYLEYWIDQITGACTAALYIYDNDGAVVYGDTVSGVCAVDIPLTGVDQATIQSQIFNANQQLKLANINAASSLINSTLDIAGNAFSGNAAGAATSAIGGISSFLKNNAAVESAQYQLHHNKMTPRQISAASPLCAMLGDWIPRIIISKPKDALSKAAQQEFSQTKGYACMIPGKIGSRTGFIQMINVHLIPPADATIAMTEGEAEMIRSLLAGGIYI